MLPPAGWGMVATQWQFAPLVTGLVAVTFWCGDRRDAEQAAVTHAAPGCAKPNGPAS
jgi:hypothetical protein